MIRLEAKGWWFTSGCPRGLAALLALLGLTAVPGLSHANDFNWGPALGTITTGSGSYTLSGLNFTSPVEDQGEYGLCWDFAAVSALECRYKLTRNDPSYSIDLSEAQYPAATNWWGGGWPTSVMNYALTTPIVQAGEMPFDAYGSDPLPGTWPLQVGWQNRGVLAGNYISGSTSVSTVKSMLKNYGPLTLTVDAETDFYWPGSGMPTSGWSIDHVVTLVGWHDATSADIVGIQAAGGYWIIKNSWGGWGYSGFGFVPYGFGSEVNAYTGPAYYTGAMATAAWQGSGGVWASGSSNWTLSGGSAYTWVNQETAAVFNSQREQQSHHQRTGHRPRPDLQPGGHGLRLLRRLAHGHGRRHRRQ